MASTLPPRPNLAATLLAQLSVGPSFRDVAAVLLREQLRERYPTLDIDPENTLVGTPVWEIVEDQVVARPPQFQALTDVLARQAVLAVPALYIEGEHFLTRQPVADPPVHLPVRIDEIAGLTNVLAPVMISGYKDQQLAYWNASNGNDTPHWQQLAATLRQMWNVDRIEGWAEPDCIMARQLFRTPDQTSRRAQDPYGTRAYLLEMEAVDEQGQARHLYEHLITVLVGTQDNKTVILTHSLLDGFDRFTSFDQLGAALPGTLDSSIDHGNVQWRLVEPAGDYFDYLACALIAVQIEAINRLDFSDVRYGHASAAPLAGPPNAAVAGAGVDLGQYEQALPDWLKSASTPDLNASSRHLKDLATLHRLNEGKTYLDAIASIQTYALNQLNAEMLKDHPAAGPHLLEKVELVVKSPVVWGAFTLPGRIDTTVLSLTELALQNLIAVPLGNKTLRRTKGGVLPAWLTVEYVESLVKRADIGSTYPALINRTLLQDAEECARRRTLYTQHLQVQLPLLALQCKIRGQHGIDERGYRYVAALMQAQVADRVVDEQPIVIRELAFVPQRRTDAAPDKVSNMYIIGPKDSGAGPCLLYRPLLDPPLIQYPSTANALYAIQQSSQLREAVLAWLPDEVRADYNRYVFPGALPSPWAVADFLVEPLKLWTLSGPMALGEHALDGDIFATLYTANTHALVSLADRQSVSNAQARWETFKRAGWLIFNAALPFMGSTVGAAAWIWQVMDQLQAVADAQTHRQSPWAALSDLLLNLGMAVSLLVATRSTPQRRAATKLPAPPSRPSSPKPASIKQLADIAADSPSAAATRPLLTAGAINRTQSRLSEVLDRFKVTKPDNLGEPISAEGPYVNLYTDGDTYYAPVGTRWFEVQVDEGDAVQIIDPSDPERTGPPLIGNRQGAWFIDTRLRLRGGGPKVQIRKAKALAQKRADELRQQLSAFEQDKKNAQTQLQRARQAMDEAPSTSAQARRQAYQQTLATQRDAYEAALQKLKELNVHAPTPDYAQKALNYLKAQTELSREDIRQAMTRFTPMLRSVLDQIEREDATPQQRDIANAQEMSDMNRQMIQRLDYMQGRFDELRKLQRDGIRLITTIKGSLPAFSSDYLKALQVLLGRDLCLSAVTRQSLPDAWKTLSNIIDSAEVAIQCLHDTLDERSESRLDERFDTLSSLIEQFDLVNERLQDFHSLYATHIEAEPFENLRRQLMEFNQRTSTQLAVLSAERETFRNRPSPLAPPPRPKKRFIRTRFDGMLIGEPRLSDVGLETGLVDILSPFTHKVVATYHEKTPGMWVEHLPSSLASPATIDVHTSTRTGQALLDELPALRQRLQRLAQQPERSPLGIEWAYNQQAKMLEDAASAIERALTQSNATDASQLPASTVSKALSEAVAELYRLSNEQVLTLFKQRPPTVSAVEWLKRHNAITLKKTVTRRRLKNLHPDYLDEYTITDQSNHQVLWYAHFHYSASWTPARAYLSARLKTVEEHRLGAAADLLRNGSSEAQKLAFYRSEISLEQARQLFFQ
ncbi:hypothetical protein [Pseudomonas trivialis]|uniref:Uncharacterized protein n=1 Tax=Pseudomonas trivialis TaxID=200450 RepID=A0A0R2ZQ11_9PSED|nr:hypothetical protein [Pseudomonas trivialis]KRP62976.1 hypothetical protein TU79_01000 [Pseudomonas trivialis]SDS04959.1 hypothetical protein SAMN04490205_1298 [Pseudomonas trivialis]